jgi:FKBP-type peptidyl-prolyl cis-trans isomerase FkpA
MNCLGKFLKIGFFVLIALTLVFGCKKIENTSNSSVQETLLIRAWVDATKKNSYAVDSTTTGMYYVIEKVGTGAVAQAGNSVTIAYTGKFLDGTTFDASSSYTYVHKGASSRMIPGWEDAIEKLSKGGKGVFLIPSAQAYGPNGYMVVPPYTPLLFGIEILEIQ